MLFCQAAKSVIRSLCEPEFILCVALDQGVTPQATPRGKLQSPLRGCTLRQGRPGRFSGPVAP